MGNKNCACVVTGSVTTNGGHCDVIVYYSSKVGYVHNNRRWVQEVEVIWIQDQGHTKVTSQSYNRRIPLTWVINQFPWKQNNQWAGHPEYLGKVVTVLDDRSIPYGHRTPLNNGWWALLWKAMGLIYYMI